MKKLLTIILIILFFAAPVIIGEVKFPTEITAETVMEYLADTVVFYIRLISIFVKTLLNKL
jgi:hypothetical protein